MSTYSRDYISKIKKVAKELYGATLVIHIYPRAYCIKKLGDYEAIFVLPECDSVESRKGYHVATQWTVDIADRNVEENSWYVVAYVVTHEGGWFRVIPWNLLS